jgi:hypothetical protein
MSEETDAPEGGAEAIVVHETLDPAPVVETPVAEIADDTAAQQTEAEETGQADETSEAPKRKPWWEKRFDELTADKHAERRRAEAAERRLQALEQQPQVEQRQAETPPDRWDDPEGYDRWIIDRAKTEVRAEFTREKTVSTYAERVAKAREAKPDFDSVTTNPDLTITPAMAQVIVDSDIGPEVAYHLGTNPQEAARIAALPQHRQAAELGKLEAKLSQPAPAPAPTRNPPPPPPQTVAGLSAGIAKAPEDMSMSEYIKWRSKGD